jgi:hypothetical protein
MPALDNTQPASGTGGATPARTGWSTESSFEPFKFLGELAAEKKQVELEIKNGTPASERIARRYYNGSAEGPSVATHRVDQLLRQYDAAPASNKPSIDALAAAWEKSPDGLSSADDALDVKYTLSVHALATDLIATGETARAKEALGTAKDRLSTSAFDWFVTAGDRRKVAEAMSDLSAPEFFWVVGQLRSEGKASEFFANGVNDQLTRLTDQMAQKLGDQVGLGEGISSAVSYHLSMNWKDL